MIRGIASTYVVLFHINVPIPFISNWWTEFCKLGWLGVPAFFVISGFCMALIEENSTPRHFLMSRLARIYIPYLASVLLVLFVVVMLKFTQGVNDVISLPKEATAIVFTSLMLLSPITKVAGINWVYWSLVVEMCFYVYFAVCLQMAKDRRLLLIAPLLLYAWRDMEIRDVFPLIWIGHYAVFLTGYFLQ